MTIVVQALELGGSGPTVMVKDTGYPTRASSQSLQDAPPATLHATVVQSVLDAGCRLTGKPVCMNWPLAPPGSTTGPVPPLIRASPTVYRAVLQAVLRPL